MQVTVSNSAEGAAPMCGTVWLILPVTDSCPRSLYLLESILCYHCRRVDTILIGFRYRKGKKQGESVAASIFCDHFPRHCKAPDVANRFSIASTSFFFLASRWTMTSTDGATRDSDEVSNVSIVAIKRARIVDSRPTKYNRFFSIQSSSMSRWFSLPSEETGMYRCLVN